MAPIDANVRPQRVLRHALVALNVAVRLYCAAEMIISDCDETFNYWEPLNVLVRGFGKQTWEYSPEYAIRSWAYLLIYYVAYLPFGWVLGGVPSFYAFYWLRVVMAGFTSYTEISLARSLDAFGAGNWFLLFSSVSAGMLHAGIALLPSSFAMQLVSLATSLAIEAIGLRQPIKLARNLLVLFGVSGLVGWPFTLALALPFGLYCFTFPYFELLEIIFSSAIVLVTVLVAIMGIDTHFYNTKIFSVVPLNIVLYNVFGGEGEGPDIFGTEPFSYYVLNLLVNFNVVAVLAVFGVFSWVLYDYRSRPKILVGVIAPLVLWLGIFATQPHKEERFLYPVYPLICVSAALLHTKVVQLVSLVSSKLRSPILTRLYVVGFGVGVTLVSLLRIANLVENYSAPLSVARAFHTQGDLGPQNVCVGREWYHFPTSFFLPDNHRLRFTRSGFDGLLPGDFPENVSWQQAASSIPHDMNNLNQWSEAKVVSFTECDYYIDNTQPINPASGEIDVRGDANWSKVQCASIINPSGQHHGVGRLIYIPKLLRPVIPYNVEQMDLCVYKRKEVV